ncbi:MAG: aldo/keto reductase [Bacteroides sp.]|nr:aldo/keto reductase [Prevotella sp.]MCM1407740.1 aldo/keto reductase [Treponema brennaborense]MCM1469110.1 aldo/keto reductase [Bacteroides sp.]
MIYNDFQDLKLSALGMGSMRLPIIKNDADIDKEKARAIIKRAMELGINYYDTAWGYHSGNSETVLGSALADYPRESFYLADKFPGYDLANMDKVEEIFEAQLKKCGVDYFDFYLFHNVCEMNIDAYLDRSHKIFEYLTAQKENGRIRHLGFSVHGSLEVTKRFLDAYGSKMEFCQIQLNYIDYHFQDAKSKIELLNASGIPIWVMEPVRGGKLAALPDSVTAQLRAISPEDSDVTWAFRFLQTIPGVTVTLSGMSTLEQLEENARIFEKRRPLSQQETDTLLAAAENMMDGVLPCTACHYCVSHCPKGLDIPRLIELYNEHRFTGGGFIAPMALLAIPQEKHPNACIGCRSCEAVCPQTIKISEAMTDFTKRLQS